MRTVSAGTGRTKLSACITDYPSHCIICLHPPVAHHHPGVHGVPARAWSTCWSTKAFVAPTPGSAFNIPLIHGGLICSVSKMWPLFFGRCCDSFVFMFCCAVLFLLHIHVACTSLIIHTVLHLTTLNPFFNTRFSTWEAYGWQFGASG